MILKIIACVVPLTLAHADVTASSVNLNHSQSAYDATLSKGEQDQWIEKAQNFLNGIKTMRARFIQVTYHPQGGVESRTGSLKWLLPAHIRFTYDGEPALDVASDGVSFRQKDEDGISSALDIDSTPAGMILKRGISFRRDAIIRDIIAQDGEVAFVLSSPDDPKGATLTLIFKKTPCVLTKWSTREPSGRVIQIELVDAKMNLPLSKKDFDL